jgi:hypothetical protein
VSRKAVVSINFQRAVGRTIEHLPARMDRSRQCTSGSTFEAKSCGGGLTPPEKTSALCALAPWTDSLRSKAPTGGDYGLGAVSAFRWTALDSAQSPGTLGGCPDPEDATTPERRFSALSRRGVLDLRIDTRGAFRRRLAIILRPRDPPCAGDPEGSPACATFRRRFSRACGGPGTAFSPDGGRGGGAGDGRYRSLKNQIR